MRILIFGVFVNLCYIFFRADSKERKKARKRSRSRTPEKKDESALSFDPANLDKVCICTTALLV